MTSEYDIFEKFPDGQVRWLCCVVGLETAKLRLSELAQGKSNELFALDLAGKRVVARANAAVDQNVA